MKRYGYTESLLFFFVIPFLFLFQEILATVQLKPFVGTIAVVCCVGWSWSSFLSYKKWWAFPNKDILGVRVTRYLPLEEFLIYPIGGSFSIFLYILVQHQSIFDSAPFIQWALFILISAGFTKLAATPSKGRSFYLISQLLVFNLPCMLLAPFTVKSIAIAGLVFSVAVLSIVGFIWDLLAFKFGWWRYFAVSGVKLIRVPIEDVNFYLMAPATAISVYVLLCRIFPVS